MLEDLVAICPTCHRAIHRFYDEYLRDKTREDFFDKEEASVVYGKAKGEIIKGEIYD